MKKIVLSRLTILSCCIALFTLASVTHTIGQIRSLSPTIGQSSSNPTITTKPIRLISNQSLVPTGGTMLARSSEGIFMNIHTAGLVPGTVATAWIVVFNNPAECATNPCGATDIPNPAVQGLLMNGGGKIVGTDGTANFGGFRTVGDTTGIFGGTAPAGFFFPMTAEIHLVVRTHGAAILNDANVLNQQLTSFNGGCPPNTCVTIQTSIHQP